MQDWCVVRVMEIGPAATVKDGDEDSGVGSLNSGGQTVICIYVPKHDVKVNTNRVFSST